MVDSVSWEEEGWRGNIDVRLRRIIRRIRPHSSLLTTHSQHDTRRNWIRSVMSSLSRIKKRYSICKVSWKVLLQFLMSNLNFKDNENIDIFFRYLFLAPPTLFYFRRCNSFKRKKSQLTVISLALGLGLPFPFLWVFFQLSVVKHKKAIWEGAFRHPRITSFDQFVHDFEKMS